jgi:hypothetical protein
LDKMILLINAPKMPIGNKIVAKYAKNNSSHLTRP